MGIGLFRSFSKVDKKVSRSILGRTSDSSFSSSRKKVPKDPDPSNYRILKYIQMGEYLLMEMRYLDCTNYEGRKILLFRSTIEELSRQRLIDPHFSDNKAYISPIARFEPTNEGWRMGKALVKVMRNERQ